MDKRSLLVLSTALVTACSASSPPGSPRVDASTSAPDAHRADAASRRDATRKDAARPSDASDAEADTFTFDAGDAYVPLASWTTEARMFVNGFESAAAEWEDCRTQICQHNEDTDMIAWNGAIYMVHRTARSQVLGPDSSLLIYKSSDGGVTFQQVMRIPAPSGPIDAEDTNDAAAMGRDIRDPAFFIVTDAQGVQSLHLKAITRLPTNLAETQTRDTNVDSISVGFVSSDGVHWGPLTRLGPDLWSFWRVKQIGGVFYSAAYHDGDSSVSLFSSPDGVTWTQGVQVFGVSALTPLETELVGMPNGNMLALVRTDGADIDLPGNDGNQKTRVCWARPPFTSFDCPETILGERFDGPVAFFWQGRLFVIARRHVDTDLMRNRKRTSLFELSPVAGDAGSTAHAPPDAGIVMDVPPADASISMSADWSMASDGDGGGAWSEDEPLLAAKWWGDLPSAGDTAYAGVAFTDT
ncbi:MAG: hypothetical protein ACLQVI_30995, partial [Polyangiaceae bacterium]